VVEKPKNVGCIKGLLTITGWWFKEPWNFMTFQISWEFQKIPTDFHSIIFQKGGSTTNQINKSLKTVFGFPPGWP